MVDTKEVKSVGEHYVCAALARRGWAPALTRDGLARTDILAVQTNESGLQIQVQVKATSHSKWIIGENSQKPSVGDHEWFVLVQIAQDPSGPVRCFVVPRDHIVAGVWIAHQDWLTDPDAPVGKRNAHVDKARAAMDIWLGYEDRWDLLNSPTSRTPVLLPPHFRELAQGSRVGLPPGHPWHDALPLW